MTTQTFVPPLAADRPALLPRGATAALVCVAFGCALTLAIQGYQFGKSNHTVYLLDALRHVSPGSLQNDWFTTQTLQYHAAFGVLTRGLMTLGILEPAFLVGYAALLVLLHTAWWRIVRLLGGGAAAFLLSEILFHLLAGGTGLGMYQFLQDGAFLPSNIASVAMLWGLYLGMAGRRAPSAVMFGVAGLFHLNYALVAPLVWLALKLEARWWDGRRLTLNEALGAIAMIELCLMNMVPAMVVTWHRSDAMPLNQFVDLYVHLRHPHHYDPSAWPAALWASFLIPIPLAWCGWRTSVEEEWREPVLNATREAARIVEIFVILLLVALLTAGIWYVSETAVQLSLWRFSIFVKLLTCVGVAMWVEQRLGRARFATSGVAATLGAAMVFACVARGPYFGLFRIPEDPPSYLAACDWIREHTPSDVVFLVPPDEQEFRLRAQRAIVVNYKCVPQLSRELGEWRDRLSNVLDMRDLRVLPGPFEKTLSAIHARYEALPPEHYEDAARRYGARYVLVGHELPAAWAVRRVDLNGNTSWFLYDLSR